MVIVFQDLLSHTSEDSDETCVKALLKNHLVGYLPPFVMDYFSAREQTYSKFE